MAQSNEQGEAMTTNNTQAELRELLAREGAIDDGNYHSDSVGALISLLADYTNKQIEALLNEMLVDVSSPNARIDQAEMIELINLYINKLKEES